MHDFNPGILPDGLFWMVRVPDDALEIRGNTVTIRLKNVPVVDTFTFYDPLPPSGNVPAMTSFEMSYTRSGAPRQVRPTSADPISPFNWAGVDGNGVGHILRDLQGWQFLSAREREFLRKFWRDWHGKERCLRSSTGMRAG